MLDPFRILTSHERMLDAQHEVAIWKAHFHIQKGVIKALEERIAELNEQVIASKTDLMEMQRRRCDE